MAYSYDDVGSRCLEEQPGMRALADYCVEKFPGILDWGIFSCRGNTGGSGLSVHAEGRAWDAGVRTLSSPTGSRLASWLVENAQLLGVQRVIWNRRVWDSLRVMWRPYTGPHPHTDHVHAELSWATAKTLTEARIRSLTEPEEDDDMPMIIDSPGHPPLFVFGDEAVTISGDDLTAMQRAGVKLVQVSDGFWEKVNKKSNVEP